MSSETHLAVMSEKVAKQAAMLVLEWFSSDRFAASALLPVVVARSSQVCKAWKCETTPLWTRTLMLYLGL